MAQTPARDIIKDAVVDFRFYNGNLKNYANNSNALVFDIEDPILMKAKGVDALVYNRTGSADQTWMTTGITELTIELLVCPDMYHEPATGDTASTTIPIYGDWKLGFANVPGDGSSFSTRLWASFNGEEYGSTTYIIRQDLEAFDGTLSKFKGSPMHIIISALFTSSTSLEVTTYVNGVYSNETSTDHTNHYIDPTPSNTLFDGAVSGYIDAGDAACPVYMLRMWDSYMEDELVFADMFYQAKKILPSAQFPAPISGTLEFYVPA